MNKKMINLAISLIESMENDDRALRKINKETRKLYGDFFPELSRMTDATEGCAVALLDALLGDELASYFLYECTIMNNGGMIEEKCGRKWPLKTISDLRRYAYHIAGLK